MSKVLYEVEIRIPPATAKLGLAAALFLLLAPDITSESLTFDTHYAVPSGAFDGLTVTGLDTAGNPRYTLLNPTGAVGIQTGGSALAGGPKLISQNAIVVGGNVVPLAAVHSQRGMALASRNSGGWWTVYPNANNFQVSYQGGAPVFTIQPNGGMPLCTQLTYVYHTNDGTNGTFCPAGSYVVGPASDPAGAAPPYTYNGVVHTPQYTGVSGVPLNGSVTCCRLLEELP